MGSTMVAPFSRRPSSSLSSTHTVVVRRDSIDFGSSPDVSAPLLHGYRSSSIGGSSVSSEKSATSSHGSSLSLTQSQWRHKLPIKPLRRRCFSRAYMVLATLTVSGLVAYIILVGSASKAERGSSSLRLNQAGTHAYAIHDPNLAPYEPHPIQQLIKEAKVAWRAKNARQSKTYKDAVDEYRRRYKREPPRGFEVWYEWARANEIPLIDEYDMISQQITPYLALRPSEVRRRIEQLDDPRGATSQDHTILRLFRGRSHYTGSKWREPVSESFESLIEDIVDLIPDVVVPLYQHDASFIQMDYEVKQAYIETAENGECELACCAQVMSAL